MNNFSLEVVSKLPQFSGQVMRPYFVDGIDTIGVWGDEPFELRFKNHTGQKAQVRLSLDGTDILTGKLAHTDITSDGMWVVQAHDEMVLKAWPETNQKGREFVFTHEGLSVATHTHDNTEHRGIIAAAVFTETEVPRYDRFWLKQDDSYKTEGGWWVSYDAKIGAAPMISFNDEQKMSKSAVGAGQEVIQKIGQTQGLFRPKLDRIIRIRHIWFDDLKARLENNRNVFSVHASGFPGDRERNFMDLSRVPVAGQTKAALEVHRFI